MFCNCFLFSVFNLRFSSNGAVLVRISQQFSFDLLKDYSFTCTNLKSSSLFTKNLLKVILLMLFLYKY